MAHRLLGLMLPLVIAVSACSKPSADDLVRLEVLRRKWGGNYDFALGDAPYMSATARSGVTLDEAELAPALIDFLNGDDVNRHRRSTLYVYLNVYRADKVFAFQLYLQDGTVQKSRAEFY